MRTTRSSLPPRVGLAITFLCSGALFASGPAQAVQCGTVNFPGTEKTFFLNGTYTTFGFNQPGPYWAGLSVLALDDSDDYDAYLYGSCQGGLLAASTRVAGYNDFVLGDFNHDPTGLQTADLTCYAGACMGSGVHGAATWRIGSLMVVDAAPLQVSFPGPTYSPDMLMHVWDVYLNAGTTYYFQYSSSLGNGSRMLLFRNHTGGTYYASRASAEFEVFGCTTYTAPTDGYYGLVVVNDYWSFGDYTIGVTSQPVCLCAQTSIFSGVPVALAAPLEQHYTTITQTDPYWTAVGLRPQSGSDWDLELGDTSGWPTCINTVLASSTFGPGVTDVVVGDYSHGGFSYPAVHSYRYSGLGGATLEWDASNNSSSDVLTVNGTQVTRSWGPSDVLECWDVGLLSGTKYTFQFYPSSTSVKLLLFRNPGSSFYMGGRASAVLQATSTTTYTAPSSGFYGVVVVKDDDQPGTFALRVGQCDDPDTLHAGARITMGDGTNFFYKAFTPDAGSWTAVGTRSFKADWDLAQYGTSSGAAWPDCYGPPGANSESAIVPDFIVGDFRANAPGTYHLRAKQYTNVPGTSVDMQWTGAAVRLTVNGTPATGTPDSTELLRLYEVSLEQGENYRIRFVQPETGSLRMFLFANTGAGEFWAPRGAALLEGTGNATFVAPITGSYAIVITNDTAQPNNFELQVMLRALAVDDPPRTETRLIGATPNPGRADLAVRYSLAKSAEVEVALLDLAGRRVWGASEERGPGEWSVPVRRNAAGGARIPAGLYFVRLVVAGRVVDTRKVSLLD